MLSELVGRSLQAEYLDGRPPDDAPPGHSTGWRTRPFFIFSCSTRGSFVLHPENRPDVVIRTGEAFLLPAGLAHKVDVGPKRAWAMWCHLNFTILGAVDVLTLVTLPLALGARQARPLAAICRHLAALDRKPVPHHLWQASRRKELAFQFLTLLLARSEPRPDHADFLVRSRSLEPVLRHIQQHLADPLAVADLARLAGRSRSGFHHEFRVAMGKPPWAFIRDLRVRTAQLLLAGSDFQVAEVGQRVGYPDPFHFSRMFKAGCGMSPSQFRDAQRKGLWSG